VILLFYHIKIPGVLLFSGEIYEEMVEKFENWMERKNALKAIAFRAFQGGWSHPPARPVGDKGS